MKISRRGATRPIQGILAVSLALCSSAALALGLGNIRVLSKPGQPLVAEIPVISNEPGELDNARIGLASDATFQRVGLAPPEAAVRNLRFNLTQDAHGRTVIRVTSPANIDAEMVNFLIEVDWGKGRLVREYAALVDAPAQAAMVAEPIIEAPQAAQQNLIVRDPEPLPAAEPDREAAVATPAPPQRSAQPPVARASVTTPAAAPSTPAPAADGTVVVRKGQSASQIARDIAKANGVSLNQTMVALLQANPEAFIRNNVHLLKQGAVLRVPRGDELTRVDAAEAEAVMRTQTAQWRQARAPIPQPAGEPVGALASEGPAAVAGPAAAQARLEIAPAKAGDGKAAGAASGLQEGGDGDMLAKEQLQQAREELASREVELTELRNRVAELEKLKEQQQALIEMKDSDLAAAQKRLAEAPRAEAGSDNAPVWIGLGGAVLAVLGLAWWLGRRRKPSPLPALATASGFEPTWPGATPAAEDDRVDADTLAQTEPVADDASSDIDRRDLIDQDEAVIAVPADIEPVTPAFELEPAPGSRVDDAFDPEPAPREVENKAELLWYSPVPESTPTPAAAGLDKELQELADALEAQQRASARPAVNVLDVDAEAAEPVQPAAPQRPWQMEQLPPMRPLHPAPAARERLELAVAYMDLGDANTARTLLREVAESNDPQASQEALELLGRLQ